MENPDGPDDARFQDVSDEGGEVIQPIGEADLPEHVFQRLLIASTIAYF